MVGSALVCWSPLVPAQGKHKSSIGLMSTKHTSDVSFQMVKSLICEKLQCNELTDAQKESFLNGVHSFVK